MTIELANRLAKLRKENGYSQEELANKLGISRQAVSKWENGEASPDTDNLLALSSLYGISIDELINHKMVDEKKSGDKHVIRVNLLGGPGLLKDFLVCAAILSYIVIGGLTQDGWAWGWTLILDAIWVSSLVEAIKEKKPEEFSIGLMVTSLYCKVGFLCGRNGSLNWGNFWYVFLVIPFYYSLVSLIRGLAKKK